MIKLSFRKQVNFWILRAAENEVEWCDGRYLAKKCSKNCICLFLREMHAKSQCSKINTNKSHITKLLSYILLSSRHSRVRHIKNSSSSEICGIRSKWYIGQRHDFRPLCKKIFLVIVYCYFLTQISFCFLFNCYRVEIAQLQS